MLYERWRQVARERHAEVALRDLASDRAWTFGELEAEGERAGAGTPAVVCPQGQGPEFVWAVLRAWRDQRLVCPLEPGPVPAGPLEAVLARPARLRETWPEAVHLKLTSATTGRPRLIAFTAPQLAADAAQIVSTMGLRPDWPNVGAISLAHSYGFSNLVTPLLLHGIPLLLPGSPLPEALRRADDAVRALTLPGVPALWRAWHEADAIPHATRLAVSAGAALPLALEAEVFAARGLKVHNFYGASECGGIAYDRTAVVRADAACVGRAMDGVSLAVGTDGCLEVRSRSVGLGYWPEAEAALGGGRFRTSDLAEVEAGAVRLCGRAGDRIHVAGRKVSPDAIEAALLGHPAVRDCAVVGVVSADADRGEEVAALVAVRSPVDPDDLRRYLLERLPAWQVPRRWRFVDALEVNVRGKRSRAELRRAFA